MCGMHGAHNVADHEPDCGTKHFSNNKPFKFTKYLPIQKPNTCAHNMS
jgi:hypothetical protein